MNAEHTQLQERWEQVISILQANPEVSQRLRGFVNLAQPQAFVGTVLLNCRSQRTNPQYFSVSAQGALPTGSDHRFWSRCIRGFYD